MDFMRRIRNSKGQRQPQQQPAAGGGQTSQTPNPDPGPGASSSSTPQPSSSLPQPTSSVSSSTPRSSDQGRGPGHVVVTAAAAALAATATATSHPPPGFPPTPQGTVPGSGIPRFGVHKLPSRPKRSAAASRVVYMEKTICEGIPGIWAQFREEKELTDCNLLTTDGQIFPVHRAILACVSPFFMSFFTQPTQTLIKEGDTMPCPFDAETLRNVLDFAYTGKANLNPDNVRKLLTIADKLKMKVFVQQCIAYLKDSLSPTNCLSIFKFCRTYYCPEVERKGRDFILVHFKQIIGTPDFLELDFLELEDLMRDDNLNIRNEEMVFDAIRQWILYRPETRTSRLVELIQCVRYGLMSYRYFTTEVLPWEYIQNSSDAQTALYDASIFLAQMDSHQGSELDLNDPLARPRIPHDIIFAVGGWSAGSPTSFMETYDSRADRWFLINGADVTPRAYHGLANVDNWIYMIGGFDGNDHFNTVQAFNPLTRTWQEKACMHFPRCYVSCCVLDRCIYAMGGFNGRGRMNSAERYSVEKNQWDMIPPMNRQRSDASACALQGKVYVAGGFNGQEVLNSVEVYDPKISPDGTWTFIHPMSSPRSGVAITAYRGCLYALGGFNGFTRLSSGERFNPLEPTEWHALADMGSPRSNFATSVIDDMIFVIGGFNGTTTIAYVECYDGTTNEWFDVSHMNLNRSALSACVLSGLPNGREFSYLSRVQELLGLPHRATSASTALVLAAPESPST